MLRLNSVGWWICWQGKMMFWAKEDQYKGWQFREWSHHYLPSLTNNLLCLHRLFTMSMIICMFLVMMVLLSLLNTSLLPIWRSGEVSLLIGIMQGGTTTSHIWDQKRSWRGPLLTFPLMKGFVIMVNFLPIFFQHYTFFSCISPHDTRQDKPNAIHCTSQLDNMGLQQDLRLVLFGDARPPTETVHLTESLHMLLILTIMLPQKEESSELSCPSSARRVEQGLRTLLSRDKMIPSTWWRWWETSPSSGWPVLILAIWPTIDHSITSWRIQRACWSCSPWCRMVCESSCLNLGIFEELG